MRGCIMPTLNRRKLRRMAGEKAGTKNGSSALFNRTEKWENLTGHTRNANKNTDGGRDVEPVTGLTMLKGGM